MRDDTQPGLNPDDVAEKDRRMQQAIATVRREHAATIQGMTATDADEFLVVVAAGLMGAELQAAAKGGDPRAGRILRAVAVDQITAIIEDEERRVGRPIRDVAEARAVLTASLRLTGKAN